jgi:6-phosphogluconolactonase/glucosamine-6-phosphate isomerase/deaminase
MYQIMGCIPWIEQIDWESTHIFWGDERDVTLLTQKAITA